MKFTGVLFIILFLMSPIITKLNKDTNIKEVNNNNTVFISGKSVPVFFY